MKLGLIARADDRGLGHLTWAFHENMKPARTLVIDMGDPAFPNHLERFAHGEITVVEYNHQRATLPEGVVHAWLESGLDVVYSAETFYDWRFPKWATSRNVRTVLHGMPELTGHGTNHPERPHPDKWLWPTNWLLPTPKLPAGEVLAVPCPDPIEAAADPYADGPLRIVHPGGRTAIGDRDGTALLVEALYNVKAPVHVTFITQEGHFPHALPHGPNLSYEILPNGVEDRFDLYRGQHLTVLPRRYGGLSMKVLESLACGVPVMMPFCPPNSEWPGPRVMARSGPPQRVPLGRVATNVVDIRRLARYIDRIALEREALADEMFNARRWAESNNWSTAKTAYQQALTT